MSRSPHGKVAVRAAPCGVGGAVRGAWPDGAVGAVPVDDRPNPGAGVAVVDGGRGGGTVLQAAGGVLSQGRAVVEEVQGAGHHGGRDRRGHRVACCAPHAAAGPLRPGGPPAVRQPQHHPVPGRRPRCRRPAGPAARRAPMDGLDVLGRLGNAAHPRCRPSAAGCRDGSRRRRRPRQCRAVAASGPAAPCARTSTWRRCRCSASEPR